MITTSGTYPLSCVTLIFRSSYSSHGGDRKPEPNLLNMEKKIHIMYTYFIKEYIHTCLCFSIYCYYLTL